MLRNRLHKSHIVHKKRYRGRVSEECMNRLIQIEAHELYERMGWMFDRDVKELLEEEMLETQEFN